MNDDGAWVSSAVFTLGLLLCAYAVYTLRPEAGTPPRKAKRVRKDAPQGTGKLRRKKEWWQRPGGQPPEYSPEDN